MSRAKAGPRDRLIRGMIVAAGRHGYGGASVARVIEQAGTSRATFYEHFSDKDDCFLAAHRKVVTRLGVHLERDRPASPREILSDVLGGLEEDPAEARFFLIEALAGSRVVRLEHEQFLQRAEDAIELYLDRASGEVPVLEVPARALMGGVLNVLAIRAFQGETAHLTGLLGDLLEWAEAYAVPAPHQRLGRAEWAELGKRLRAPLDFREQGVSGKGLPRGRGALAPQAIAAEHRDRVLAAVARLSREKGYTAMTVADIVATASVTREVFYALFRSKEDAFLATQAYGLQASVALTAGKFFGAESWPDRVWNGSEALLGYIAGQVDLAHVDVVESYAAGPAAIRRSFDNRMAYTLFLEDGYRLRPEAEHLPRLCSEAIGGANFELMRCQIVRGHTEQMLELLPQMAYVTLAPFTGPQRALELGREKRAKIQRRMSSERSSVPPASG